MRIYTEKFRLAGLEERPMNIVYFVLREYLHEKVLDVGCGQGRHLRLMPKGSIGIDLYPNKELNTEYGLLIHDLNNGLPFKNESFNAIFASHVLEHLESPYKMLKEFYRCLKLGGTLIVGIPNPDCIYFHQLLQLKKPRQNSFPVL
ncbi:MAG: class I SAM-dependent methyltransferase, partial [archaeon]|nr:class I SAM-dependent methyltransferase [archaeon]